MVNYDSGLFTPPAPVAYVSVVNPENGSQASSIVMLIDSGADVTLIPKFSTDPLGLDLSESREVELASFDGSKTTVPSARLEIVLDGKRFRGRFPIIDQPYGIVGRNLLNELKVELDGPEMSWRIL